MSIPIDVESLIIVVAYIETDLCTIGCRNLYYEGSIILDDKIMVACSRILPGSVLSIELYGV
jgi:hypothetical protein